MSNQGFSPELNLDVKLEGWPAATAIIAVSFSVVLIYAIKTYA